jgi:hypothetical protein
MNSAPGISSDAPRWPRASDNYGGRVVDRRAARASGLLGSIVVNAILLYAAHHVLEWQVGWITPAWSDVLWAVDLTLWGSIVANALFLSFDAAWFRNLAGAVSCALAVLATWWVYAVFPFDFGAAATNDIVRLMVGLVMVATAIAVVVQSIMGVVDLVRAAIKA